MESTNSNAVDHWKEVNIVDTHHTCIVMTAGELICFPWMQGGM